MSPRCIPLVLCAAIATACDADVPHGPREGQRAPAFEVPSLQGDRVAVDSSLDRPAVLVFWASWCGPCQRESAEVARLVEHYGDRVAVFSINAGEDTTKARITAEKWGMTWPVGLDPKGRVSAAYEVESIPLVIVLDDKRRVRYRGNRLPSDAHHLLDGLRG